jgi:hypothetical protein
MALLTGRRSHGRSARGTPRGLHRNRGETKRAIAGGRRRFCLARVPPGLSHRRGLDDQEEYDGHKDQKVDDRPEERAEEKRAPIHSGREETREIHVHRRRNERIDDVHHQRHYQCDERQADDDGDRQGDQIALHDERFEIV